jgi:electron transport complex protein RnfE
LLLMASIREIFGSGTLFGLQVLPSFIEPMIVFVTPPGGFAVLGVVIAASVIVEHHKKKEKGEPIKPVTKDEFCAICGLCDFAQKTQLEIDSCDVKVKGTADKKERDS